MTTDSLKGKQIPENTSSSQKRDATSYQEAVPIISVHLTDTVDDMAQSGQILPVLLNCYFKFPAF